MCNLPDRVPDEPERVGDGDLLAGVQQLLLLQVEVLERLDNFTILV